MQGNWYFNQYVNKATKRKGIERHFKHTLKTLGKATDNN